MDAKEILDKILNSYEGSFGKFNPDEDNDEDEATALMPIKNRHTEGSRITITITDDPESDYTNRVAFIDEKTKPGFMGKPSDVSLRFGFDKEHGRINNYSVMGMKGGYTFFVGYIGNVLVTCELHIQKRNQSETDDLKPFMDLVVKTIHECSEN